MSPYLIMALVGSYFILLVIVSMLTSKRGDNAAFFLGNRQSPWYVVAFGMIGASLSGVTFISVPGWVGVNGFAYMQMVLGYLVGYAVIAGVLMPLYYRLQLTSIYTYLEQRFGRWSYKTGALCFLFSRIIGAAFRLYLVAMVMQLLVFDALGWHVPFALTVIIAIALIWLYTFRGGIRTIVWTDTLQTLCMLVAVGLSIWQITRAMGIGLNDIPGTISNSPFGNMWFFEDPADKRFFFKQFFSGAFIALVMTGLDQDMMQKNLSCKNLKEAQINMVSFSIVLVPVNLIFLGLGALLFIFAHRNGIPLPDNPDQLYPVIATQYLGPVVGTAFIIGLVAAAYSSADSALTALTTSFCVDFLGITNDREHKSMRTRKLVHVGVSALLVIVILIFSAIGNNSVISKIFQAAGYTYGPLLGLYAFGLLSKRKVRDSWVLPLCIVAPVLCYLIKLACASWLNYDFGFELLIMNGILVVLGLYLLSLGMPGADRDKIKVTNQFG